MKSSLKLIFSFICFFVFTDLAYAAGYLGAMHRDPTANIDIKVDPDGKITTSGSASDGKNQVGISQIGVTDGCLQTTKNPTPINSELQCGYSGQVVVKYENTGSSSYNGLVNGGLNVTDQVIKQGDKTITIKNGKVSVSCVSNTTTDYTPGGGSGPSAPAKPAKTCKDGSTYTLNYLITKDIDASKSGTFADAANGYVFAELSRINKKLDLTKYDIIEEKSIPVNSSNISEFVDHYNLSGYSYSTMSKHKGKDYYIRPLQYRVGDYFYDGSTGHKIVDGKVDFNSEILRDPKTLDPLTTIEADSASVRAVRDSNNNTISITVTRSVSKDKNFILASGHANSKGYVVHPVWHQVKMCELVEGEKDDDTDCSATKSTPTCSWGGTIASFHELEDGSASCAQNNGGIGFTIVSNEYCLVKGFDNVDIEYPGKKSVAAGRYFTLNNYIPKAYGDRTLIGMVDNASGFYSDVENDNKNAKEIAKNYYDNKLKIEAKEQEIANYVPPVPDPETGLLPPGSITLEELEAQLQELEANKETLKNSYKAALESLVGHVNNYNKCYSWLQNVMNLKVSNLAISAAGMTSDKKDYNMDPSFSFNYNDEDNYVFNGGKPKSELNNGTKSVTQNATNSNVSYGTGEPDSDFGNGGSEPAANHDINLPNCDLETGQCTDSKHGVPASTWMKKVWEFSGQISMTPIYTIVPSGIVTTTAANNLKLPELSIPVNINTVEDEYKYTIDVGGILPERDASISKGLTPYKCTYNVINDIYIPDERLNYFYRPVDTADINHPNNEPLGYNWKTAGANKAIEKMKKDSESYQILTSKENDQFKFRLTPNLMRQIRKYNATSDNSFADFNLTCKNPSDSDMDNGYHCYSPFLSCITSKGQIAEGNSAVSTHFPSCENAFEDALRNYDHEYDLGLLNENRKKLIQKQQSLGS